MFTYVENEELHELLINTGVLHEVNRTFFHPLGLALTLKYEDPTLHYNLELKLQKDDDKAGTTFPYLDKFKMTMFRDFANMKYMDREEELGFVIQTNDFTEEDENYKKNKNIKTQRLDIIFKFFRVFAFEMQKKFIKHHPDNDDDNYFCARGLIVNAFNKSVEDGDWVSVANWAMMLQYYEELKGEITSLEVKEEVKKDQYASTGAMAHAWFGTPGATVAINQVFGKDVKEENNDTKA